MNGWLQQLAGLGVGAILATVITGLFSRRKLSAEATKIITDAASGTLKDLRDENTRLAARVAATETQQDQLRDIQRRQDERQRADHQALAIHAFWDRQAWNTLKEQGIDLPEPPPLPSQGAP